MDPLDQLTQDVFASLPPEIQTTITKGVWRMELGQISEKHALSGPQKDRLEFEVLLTLLALERLEDLSANIAKELVVNRDTANGIAKEIIETIFKDIGGLLMRITDIIDAHPQPTEGTPKSSGRVDIVQSSKTYRTSQDRLIDEIEHPAPTPMKDAGPVPLTPKTGNQVNLRQNQPLEQKPRLTSVPNYSGSIRPAPASQAPSNLPTEYHDMDPMPIKIVPEAPKRPLIDTSFRAMPETQAPGAAPVSKPQSVSQPTPAPAPTQPVGPRASGPRPQHDHSWPQPPSATAPSAATAEPAAASKDASSYTPEIKRVVTPAPKKKITEGNRYVSQDPYREPPEP